MAIAHLRNWLLFLLPLLAVSAPALAAPAPAGQVYRVALPGNPVVKPQWNEAELSALKDAGFNAIQLNVAWGGRPHGEPLNLNDVVALPGEEIHPVAADRQKELRRRVDLARKLGFRTIFHFGSPFMWRNPETGEIKRGSSDAFRAVPPYFDSANPKVREYEYGLLKEFRRVFPDIDDILVYTYDQDAWQASQWSMSPFSRGVPLHERLPVFIQGLHAAWTENRDAGSDHRMWWEPWELSAGQVYRILPRLPREHFGLILHCNIAEAEIARPVDLWFRTTAQYCKQLGLPVIGEAAFCDMTEETQAFRIPCPRLVDEQYLAMTRVPGVVGIKEYFGSTPTVLDLNFAMLRARLQNPEAETESLIDAMTNQFVDASRADVKAMLEELSMAMQVYPWEGSWMFRLTSQASVDHGWSAAYIHGQMADTPSWNSTRRGMFMVTDDRQPHPDLLEDIQLRCEQAYDHLSSALQRCRKAAPLQPETGDQRQYLQRLAGDIDGFARVARSFALHLRETNVAMLLRQDLEAKRPMDKRLLDELGRLLEADAENQNRQGRVMDKKALFTDDPEQFLRAELLPADKTILEKGHFTVTTR